ncbi:helix-turn-helix domain-containing protein [Kineococcus vitellinus]|uniref:helix-turn-helix domain-containing protein n=1 Tax=Kineococcus vitellinus TaxID=2696565 RepID=UPI00196B924A
MRIREGFPGQRLRVLPADVVRAASAGGPTSRLLVTDAGWFPRALHHGRARRAGASGTVVIVCAAGRGWCRAGAGTVAVGPGQALVVPAGLPHAYGAEDSDPWTIAWLHATGPDAREFERTLTGGGPRAVVVDLHDVVAVLGEVERVVEHLETDETAPTLVRASGAAWNVLAGVAADALAGSPVHREPVRRVQQHLRAHLEAPVSVTALAAMTGLSASHFAALFHAATGGGVVEYAKRLRMARACELLITTSLPVGEIARSVGYADAFYFSRQFRSVHGCSPSAFRSREQ